MKKRRFTNKSPGERQGKAAPDDIAFYFVHWLTDLAGAEPVPLEGCEKIVLKSPLKVLKNITESFARGIHFLINGISRC